MVVLPRVKVTEHDGQTRELRTRFFVKKTNGEYKAILSPTQSQQVAREAVSKPLVFKFVGLCFTLLCVIIRGQR